MENHLGPNVTITYRDTEYDGDFLPGHILLDKPGDIQRLSTAIVERLTSLQDSSPATDGTSKYYVRPITDPRDGAGFGVLYVNRPTPDPDTRFGSLLNETLLRGIQSGLRPEADPASLIPLPTPANGCHDIKRCIAIFPVSGESIPRHLLKGSYSW